VVPALEAVEMTREACCGLFACPLDRILSFLPFLDFSLAVVVVSLGIGRSSTLQYARERAPPQFWNSTVFPITNRIITGVCAGPSREVPNRQSHTRA
jgi:hypothetical protein